MSKYLVTTCSLKFIILILLVVYLCKLFNNQYRAFLCLLYTFLHILLCTLKLVSGAFFSYLLKLYYSHAIDSIYNIIIKNKALKDIHTISKLKLYLFSKSALIDEFTKHHIEVRSLWFPLHLQDYLKGSLYYGDNFSETLFEKGLCLPSSSNLTNEEFNRIGDVFNSFKK